MSARRQRGFSLPELMIAMVIGLLLMAGMAQIMVSGRKSFNIQSGMGKVQENGRFALQFLQRDIRTAGFPRADGVLPFIVGSSPCIGDGSDNTCNGDQNAPDTLRIRFNSLVNRSAAANDPHTVEDIDNSRLDCLGQTNPSGGGPRPANNVEVTVTNRYFVADLDNDGVRSLYCEGSGSPNNPQPLAEGVVNLQALFGQDIDGDTFANLYRRADQVDDWDQVVSVRFGVLVDSVEKVADAPDTQLYALLDAPPVGPYNDLRRRRAFSTTIELRNRTR